MAFTSSSGSRDPMASTSWPPRLFVSLTQPEAQRALPVTSGSRTSHLQSHPSPLSATSTLVSLPSAVLPLWCSLPLSPYPARPHSHPCKFFSNTLLRERPPPPRPPPHLSPFTFCQSTLKIKPSPGESSSWIQWLRGAAALASDQDEDSITIISMITRLRA